MLHRLKFPKLGRKKSAKDEKPEKVAVQAKAPNPYHAVEVSPGHPCCKAVHSLFGKRYLSRENPPKLPIPECTRMDECVCRFLHHEDRRVGQRRRGWGFVETRIGQELLAKQRPAEQIRRSRGRRKDD